MVAVLQTLDYKVRCSEVVGQLPLNLLINSLDLLGAAKGDFWKVDRAYERHWEGDGLHITGCLVDDASWPVFV